MARLSWPGWLVTSINVLTGNTVTHLSTNRARRRLISLKCATPLGLPLSQAATEVTLLLCTDSWNTQYVRTGVWCDDGWNPTRDPAQCPPRDAHIPDPMPTLRSQTRGTTSTSRSEDWSSQTRLPRTRQEWSARNNSQTVANICLWSTRNSLSLVTRMIAAKQSWLYPLSFIKSSTLSKV